MKTLFSDLYKKKKPEEIGDCIKVDPVSENLWKWSDRIEKFGIFLLIFILIAGVILAITSSFYEKEIGTYYTYTVKKFDWGIFSSEITKTVFYAFVEYCAYHVLALLIASLASIVQNTRTTTDIQILEYLKIHPEDDSWKEIDEPEPVVAEDVNAKIFGRISSALVSYKDETSLDEQAEKTVEAENDNIDTAEMYCPKCGNKVPSGNKFCTKCGNKMA